MPNPIDTPDCGACARGDHNGCWAMTSDHPDDGCRCYEADDLGIVHNADEAWRRAMDGA